MKVYSNILETVGHTPLVRLNKIEREFGLHCRLFAKVEKFNPAGSTKDRAALRMVEEAEKKGLLKKGATIIEPTSGNTGIGLCMVGAVKGYRVIIVMPDTMSIERRLMMTAYGAELILTEGKLGMAGAIAKAEELAKTIEGSFIPGQFVNPDNALAHYTTTAREIWEDLDGGIDVFMAGVGTGGTITGNARFFKEKNKAIEIIGIEPDTSAVLSGKSAGAHKLQGIGAGFVPEILDVSLLDKIVPIDAESAFSFGRKLAQSEGILCGITSGAVLAAAVQYAKENEGKNIVILLPDTGERYLSSEMFND